MDKIVTVFKGLFGWEQLNMTSTPLEPDLSLNCTDCKAHAGALQAYLEAKEVTNDWAVAKQAVEATVSCCGARPEKQTLIRSLTGSPMVHHWSRIRRHGRYHCFPW